MSDQLIREVDIWTGVIQPDRHDMPLPEANAVLQWGFSDQSKARMEELADRNNLAVLSDAEQSELQAYINVGQVIAILQAKARLSLRKTDDGN